MKRLLQRAAGISGETTDDIKNFVFDINGKVLSKILQQRKQLLTTLLKGMINYKKTITNIHELLPELDLDTLFKIMEAIVEETTPIINWPNSIHFQINLGGKSQTESLVIVNKNRRAQT